MASMEDNIKISLGGFAWEFAILTIDGSVEMLWHEDPAARCLYATWQCFFPETIAALTAEAQEIADPIYRDWCSAPRKSLAYECGGYTYSTK